MKSNRALVTVVRSAGDEAMSRAMIMGVVAPEIKRIQAERDLLIWAKKQKSKESPDVSFYRRKYAVKPVGRVRRMIEQALGMYVLLRETRRECA